MRSATTPRKSLKSAFTKRLWVAALWVNMLAAIFSLLFLNALNNSVAEQQLEVQVEHIKQQLREIEIVWELEATRLVTMVEISKALEASDRQVIRTRLIGLIASLGVSSTFRGVLLVDEAAGEVASYPHASGHLAGFLTPVVLEPGWKFDAQDHTLYRVISRPILVAGKPGRLLCYVAIDNALLTRIMSPGVGIDIRWQGISVFKSKLSPSLGELDYRSRFSMPPIKEGIAPEVLVSHRLITPLTTIAMFAVVFASLSTMLTTIWLVFGRWISTHLNRLKALESCFVSFGEAQTMTSEINRKIDQAAGKASDEISDLCANAKSLMHKVEKSNLMVSRLASISEHCNDAIISRDMQGMILTWNRSAERIFGYSQEECAGQPIWRFLSPTNPEMVLINNERLMCGEEVKMVELDLVDKRGCTVNLLCSMSPIKAANGDIVSVSCLLQDVTQQKNSERDRSQLEAKLREAEKLQSIGNLAGGLAHHLNNILGIVLGNLDLAIQKMDDMGETRKRLKRAEKFASRAAELIHQLMTFAQIIPIHRSPIQLAQLVTAITEQWREKLPQQWSVEVQCDHTLTVLADRQQMESVLMSLLKNAEEALGSQHGDIRIRLDCVNIAGGLQTLSEGLGSPIGQGVDAGARLARLTVADNGVGMDAQVLRRIWEPFFSTAEMNYGRGLGLSVALGIVKAHGGHIEVDSEPDKGSVFKLYFPLHGAGACQL